MDEVFEAEAFRKPAKVFRAADRARISGDKVYITHRDYDDVIFEIVAHKKESAALNKENEND